MPATSAPKKVSLALQGGGAHAAFTWGVLDRLLEEVRTGRLEIVALSGTSGGALNAAACAYGLLEGGVDAAAAKLAALWKRVAEVSPWLPAFNGTVLPTHSAQDWNVDCNPLVIAAGMAQQVSSPYFLPWITNPIAPIMSSLIGDFRALDAAGDDAPRLYVAATNVNRTSLRVFGAGEIDARVLAASACYPTLFQAVEIDDEYYWDGGFMANPALEPLLQHADDIISVLIDPLEVSGGPPVLPRQIVNRMNEISFGASWVNEVGQIEVINRLIEAGHLKDSRYRTKYFHVIRHDTYMEAIGAASKNTPSLEFFTTLRGLGEHAADRWVHRHLADVGQRSSFDVDGEVRGRTGKHP